jgi:hypothetical protein
VMNHFKFLGKDGRELSPADWLQVWAAEFPVKDYPAYEALLANHRSPSAADFELVGRWKDGVKTGNRWRANVASVAYPVWMQAASELPRYPQDDLAAEFLSDWSERRYTDEYRSKSVENRFGLSRATTLLHFIGGGRYPILDSRVRHAMTRLLSTSVPNTVRWYLDRYCPLFLDLAAVCGTTNLRQLDMALFSYGGKKPPFAG